MYRGFCGTKRRKNLHVQQAPGRAFFGERTA
jgi:hypothetical protein